MKFCGHCGRPASDPAPAAPVRTQPAQADVVAALRSFVDSQVATRLVEAGGRLTEERRFVTALFADLSGFTRLAERLDPERLLEVIDPLISRLSNIVGRYEGYVEKFAGDALLAFFGAPVSHEDDAARALLVALEMHAELGRFVGELPSDTRDLALHVGVNSGHVVARILGSEVRLDYSVLGDAVILAQRLESVAPAGATYVGESTYQLTRGGFNFEVLPQLTLKGKTSAVSAWRLLGQGVSAGPGRPFIEQARLVGRERELATIGAALDALLIGPGGAISLVGEAGVGKTRLTQAAREHVEAAKARWMEGRCLSYGAGLAYWPYADLMRRLFDIRPDLPEERASERLVTGLQERGLQDALPYLAGLLGLPAGGGVNLEPEAFRRGLPRAIASLFRTLAPAGGLVLALEDIHWADASTVALTKDLARDFTNSQLILYLTGRPEAVTALNEITAPLPPERRPRLELRPLDREAIGSLVEGILEGPPAPDLGALIAERCGGNPFFVEEIVHSFQDGGRIAQRHGSWELKESRMAAEAIPPTIEGAISARIDLLPRNEATVLQVASVIGRRVRIPLVRAVASDLPDVEVALGSLVQRRFLDREDGAGEGLVFHHPLTQEVAYSRLLRRHRRTLHLRVADAAEVMYGAGDDTIDLLARHLYLGDAGAKAVDYLVRAAQRAKRLFANAEATLHLDHAADVVRQHPELGERLPGILLQLAQLQELSGAYDEALQLYGQVRDLTGGIEAWRGMASTLRKRGKFTEAVALIDQAFASRDPQAREDLRPLWLERGWSLNWSGHLNEAIEAAQTGLSSAPSLRDVVAGYLLLQLCRIESMKGLSSDALQHGLEAQRIFEEHEDLQGLATTLRIIGLRYKSIGRLDEAASTLRRGLQLAERVGNAEEIAACLINLGLIEGDLGALDRAIECDRRAIDEYERIGHSAGRATANSNLSQHLVLHGEYEEASPYCDRALTIAEAIGQTLIVADAHRTKALIAMHLGDFAGAASQAELAADLLIKMRAVPSALQNLTLAAEALEKIGAGERAAELRERARNLTPSHG